jgi:hypothetical protein
MRSPHIVTITELRRNTLGVINGPLAQGIPVYVVQHGWVAAVVLSRAMYERSLSCERAGLGEDPPGDPAAHVGDDQLRKARGVESFGPLPRGTLFETPWAMVDPRTADFYMEDDIPVRPHRWEWIDEDRSDVDGVTWTERITQFRARSLAKRSAAGDDVAAAGGTSDEAGAATARLVE